MMKTNSFFLATGIALLYSWPIFGSNDSSLHVPSNESYNNKVYVPVYYHRPQVQQTVPTGYRSIWNSVWMKVEQRQELYFNIELKANATAQSVIEAFMKEIEGKKMIKNLLLLNTLK